MLPDEKKNNRVPDRGPGTDRKPGRPKKQVNVAPVEIHGVVNDPVNPIDRLELVYCNPRMFRKISHLYKQFNASEIELIFDPTGLKIETKDHLDKSIIYTTIPGHCMNLYYCAARTRICVRRQSLEHVLNTINKNHRKITFLLHTESYRSSLYIIIKDNDYGEDRYELDITHREDPPPNDAPDDDTNYPVKFKLSASHFKQRITNLRKLSNTFMIQKCGNGPIQLTCGKSEKINFSGAYPVDCPQMELVSTLGEQEILSVGMTIDYIKPLTNSGIGDEIGIAVDRERKMSFTTMMDNIPGRGYACSIKIYTKIQEFGL